MICGLLLASCTLASLPHSCDELFAASPFRAKSVCKPEVDHAAFGPLLFWSFVRMKSDFVDLSHIIEFRGDRMSDQKTVATHSKVKTLNTAIRLLIRFVLSYFVVSVRLLQS